MGPFPSDEERGKLIDSFCVVFGKAIADLDWDHSGVDADAGEAGKLVAEAEKMVVRMLMNWAARKEEGHPIGSPLQSSAIFLGVAAACLVGGHITPHNKGELFVVDPDVLLMEKRRFLRSFVLEVAERNLQAWHDRQMKLLMKMSVTDPFDGQEYAPPTRN